MDDLREKLRRLRGEWNQDRESRERRLRDGRADGIARGGCPSIREQLDRLAGRDPVGDGIKQVQDRQSRDKVGTLDEMLGGREVPSPQGSFYEVTSRYRMSFRHGSYALESFCGVDLEKMHAFCGGNGRAQVFPEDVLFVDLESTGLSLGSGTYAFVLGLGFFDRGGYCLHQLFLRNLPEELAFLRRAVEIIERFQVVVSFNGKRFDLPLLETRLIMSGLQVAHRGKIVWDLLYPARRVWRDRLEDCRLETIEAKRLGVVRDDKDIRGDQIPMIYYRYIHTGDMRGLDRVLYHNALDVLSLTTLATHIDRSVRDKDPCDINVLSLGRFYQRQRMSEAVSECYEIACCSGSSNLEKDTALFQLSLCKKREGKGEDAVCIWQELIRRRGSFVVECCVEMAKHFEHRARDLDRAIEMVEVALLQVRGQGGASEAALRKRLARLTRKRTEACRR